ncbi:MAG: hypothetical protein ACRDFS_08880 [Chloroflexota bacterium]
MSLRRASFEAHPHALRLRSSTLHTMRLAARLLCYERCGCTDDRPSVGYTQQQPVEYRYLLKHGELLDRLDVPALTHGVKVWFHRRFGLD